MPHLSVRVARLASALAALLLASACSSRGDATSPIALLGGSQRAAAFAGVWAFAGDNTVTHPLFSRVVADTIRLGNDGNGQWIRVEAAIGGPERYRSVGELDWSVDASGTLWIAQRCRPVELCDPIPPWFGLLREDGRLDLFPNPQFSFVAPARPYRKVAR